MTIIDELAERIAADIPGNYLTPYQQDDQSPDGLMRQGYVCRYLRTKIVHLSAQERRDVLSLLGNTDPREAQGFPHIAIEKALGTAIRRMR